jgi:hypothetical protein
MSEWIVIDYSQYWDVPREFVVRRGQDAYFLESPFDEALDDYTPNFHIYRILVAATETPMDRWSEFRQLGEHLPDVLVSQLRFNAEPIAKHPMRRSLRFVHDSVFDIIKRARSAA